MKRVFVNIVYAEDLPEETMEFKAVDSDGFFVTGNSEVLIEDPFRYITDVKNRLVADHPELADAIIYVALGEMFHAFPSGVLDDMDPVAVAAKMKHVADSQ